jgi:hypothetical protein
LQDFTTINDRINDISETVEVLGGHVDRNEKEIESMKVLKQPRVNMNWKDISSPLRSSMSQHLGSNLNKRRSDSQTETNRLENIQRLTDQDNYIKYEPKNIRERDSVLSGSKITRYLGDSFDGHDSGYKTNPNPNRVEAFREGSKERIHGNYDTNANPKFQMVSRNMRSSPGEDVIVEDVDSEFEDRQIEKPYKENNKKPNSSRQSDYTFKADEIFNNDTEQESMQKVKPKNSDKAVSLLNKKKSEESKKPPSEIDLTNKKTQNTWVEKAEENKRDAELETNYMSVKNSYNSAKDNKSRSMKQVDNRVKEEPQHLQLGPIRGNTLDEESSEEDFESELSMEDNGDFKGHIVHKHAEIKKDEQLDDWDYEEDSEKPKNKSKMYQNYNPGKQSVSNNSNKRGSKTKGKGIMDDLNLDDLISEDI